MNNQFSRPPIITLMTDFGLMDPYVGIMKGVILKIVPQATIVDLTHSISPQNIREAAFSLSTAIDYFPVGTIHLVVVDPGVGGKRRPIAVKTSQAYFVAPDNGVLTHSLKLNPASISIHLNNPAYHLPKVSKTFHGRDIFSPAAAHLARGIPIHALGDRINDLVQISISQPVYQPNGNIEGQIQHIDRFGNCITNIPATMLVRTSGLHIAIGNHGIKQIAESYDAVESGQLVALSGLFSSRRNRKRKAPVVV